MSDRDHQIRERAYVIWEQEGRPLGQADRHWEMAEKAVGALARSSVDDELLATVEEAAGFDAPERFPKIRS
jgi:hypothetical protein